jgi:hypothetical protein
MTGPPSPPSTSWPALFSHCTSTSVTVQAALSSDALSLQLQPRLSQEAAADFQMLSTHISSALLEDKPDIRYMRGTRVPGFKASAAYAKICPPGTDQLCAQATPNVLLDHVPWQHPHARLSPCPFCASEREDIGHQFGACPAAAGIWMPFLPAGPVITSVDDVCRACSSAFQAML